MGKSNDQREKVLALNKEVRTLAGYFRRESGHVNGTYIFTEHEKSSQAVERFMTYNESLAERAEHIYELFPARLERRAKLGSPPTSTELQSILEHLKSGCPIIGRVNNQLRAIICDKTKVGPEEIDHLFWEQLTEALENWQQRLTHSYYVHALIEMAVVASEIKWVAQEGKKMINIYRNLPLK